MAKLQIIGRPISNYVWTVWIAAAEKGVDVELIEAGASSTEVRGIHPLAKMPVLRHGDFTLCESRAIAGYIDDAFPGPALFPKDPVAKARVEQWVSIVNTSIDPVCVRQYLIETVAPMLLGREPDQKAIAAASAKLPALLDVLQSGITTAGFLGADAWTFADANATPILIYLLRSEVGGPLIDQRPALKAYVERMRQRPSFAKTAPQRPA